MDVYSKAWLWLWRAGSTPSLREEVSSLPSGSVRLRQSAEAGRDQQAGQSHAAHVAGGSGADCSALRSRISQAVFASLPSEAESGGQGGSGAQVGGTTLLDAAHADRVSKDRSHREQPAGAPGRRKLDRRN